jgi:hypothetical protein
MNLKEEKVMTVSASFYYASILRGAAIRDRVPIQRSFFPS